MNVAEMLNQPLRDDGFAHVCAEYTKTRDALSLPILKNIQVDIQTQNLDQRTPAELETLLARSKALTKALEEEVEVRKEIATREEELRKKKNRLEREPESVREHAVEVVRERKRNGGGSRRVWSAVVGVEARGYSESVASWVHRPCTL